MAVVKPEERIDLASSLSSLGKGELRSSKPWIVATLSAVILAYDYHSCLSAVNPSGSFR